ncbi:Zn 2cys6 transcription factor [Ophiocordyceps camponoti-floridani]|uniref:Zn 2cys6 transcription factor n=1 Tax=Ophiocordyceps camponoti-floridani TaxID=2030778 RepID=A0A8H4Q3I2_9HYPO|nr:Zn 2cys6 transcription factor [Ophiocordyceps camponoti-floridani]
MENHASSGARIDPSLVGYMAEDRDNAAAGRQEALISMLPTSTGLAIQPDALPFVIDGEVDLFLATPRAQVSAAQLPQTRAISFINSFQSAFHGWPNDRHQHSVSLQTDFTAASQLSGITCFPVEGTKWCKKCVDKGRTSSCEAFYFMNLVEEGCTQFTENHSICRQLLLEDDWRFMDFGQLVKHMELLGLSSFILANRGDQTLYELDLSLCHKYLMEASHKLTAQYLIQSFVHEQRKEKGWETCVRIGDDSARDDIGALTLFDDGPVKTTYLIRRHDKTVEICHDKPSLLVANVLSLIFGRQVECAALWRLHKQLPKHQHMSAKHLDFLTRQLLMLRWRVSVDERQRAVLCRQVDRKRIAGRSERDTARTAQMKGLEKRIERDKTLCRKLYVCFCYIRQKRGGTLSTLGDLSHQYAPSPTQCAITEQLPRNDNQEAFDLWIRDGCLAIDEAGLLDMKSVQPPDVELTMI